MSKMRAGVNGFGRVGLHLLKYWLDRAGEANFEIAAINDEVLTLEQAFNIIQNDKYVKFNAYDVSKGHGALIINHSNGKNYAIPYTTLPKNKIPWVGKVNIALECSGKYTTKLESDSYVTGKTKVAVVSATVWDADKTLVYGFNHEEYLPGMRVISYGSCTVNAYVALASYINDKYGVEDSDFSVIHNLPEYQLKNFNSLNRKFSTIQKSACSLLPFLSDEKNFAVMYTIVPYAGVSMLDFRFRVKRPISKGTLFTDLEQAITQGKLKGLYGISDTNNGPEEHKFTTHSAVIVKSTSKTVGNNIYLHGYMDNENSVNRYFDLVDYISSNLA